MRWISSLAVILFVAGVQAVEPKADGLAELRWLVGEWRGVGQGDPGTSGSERHMDSYLDGKYIRSQGRSVYPKQEKTPKARFTHSSTYGALTRRADPSSCVSSTPWASSQPTFSIKPEADPIAGS